MKITEYIKKNRLILDGGMGTLLQSRGLQPGELPERWNISHPDVIIDIHKSYFDAGSNVVSCNTFGANLLKFSREELDEIIRAAVENARSAAEMSAGCQEKWVALDIGPSGKMLAPYGDLDFEDAVALFSETVRLGVKHGVDLIFIETMNDSYETKAALLAAKENSSLPVFVSNAYAEDGKLMTGASPEVMVAMLEAMGADAIGVNCSLGPKALAPVAREYLRLSSLPVILKPNAGLPSIENGKTVYDVSAEEFAGGVAQLMSEDISIVGGCCGTTPEYISRVAEASRGIAYTAPTKKSRTVVTSYSRAVVFGEKPVLIGERINPTGKKRFKEALRAGDTDYILKEGIAQEELGAHVLDVNVGLPEIDEARVLTDAVCKLQTVTSLPLQIDTSNPVAMERALRRYNGKAMVNSVSGKRESMDAIFPLVKKYGGVVVALTLDENGIPDTAEGRVGIAEKILREAEKYGIGQEDIIFDPLTLTVSADGRAAIETLRAVELIKSELGCHTSLGVSNVSFGLPQRDKINSTFFSLALSRGLSAAIMNPYSAEMMGAYHSYMALCGMDESCAGYIKFAEDHPAESNAVSTTPKSESAREYASELQRAVIKGLGEQAARLTEEMLKESEPLGIVTNEIIPALNSVGVGFENKTVFLPQLLMSAEAAKSAFEVIKSRMSGGKAAGGCNFVLATVKGDIHDIGKNIVKLLLENYGFNVIDLGRDVPPEAVLQAVIEHDAPIAGLSALMTTTVPAMEETIKLLKENAPHCKIVVGGAVLTREYAESIGADKYARDAMETVRYAQEMAGK